MAGRYYFLIFLLFLRSDLCHCCDCKMVDIIRNIVQREMMEREILVSRVDMLESKFGTGTIKVANSPETLSDKNILERLSAIETMMEDFSTKLKETELERRYRAHHGAALTNAWKIHKYDISVMKEDIQKSISDNKNSIQDLTGEVHKHIEVVEIKVEQLINRTNNVVTKQMKTFEERFEMTQLGLSTSFQEHITLMDRDNTLFMNNTNRTLNKIRAEILTNECASNPCLNGATCVDGLESYLCICVAGYNGTRCQIEIDECLSNPCLNGATCMDGIDDYSCICPAGYMYAGINCQIEIDECHSNPCMNGATCMDGIGNYSCRCVAGYAGVNCEIEIDECHSNPCMNGATCMDGIGNYSCRCVAGYAGVTCQIANDCRALRDSGFTTNGIYTAQLWKSGVQIQVYCDMQTDGGGWTVFQNRFDGSLDFNRALIEYENGFGNLNGEFWTGLRYVQEMAQLGTTELRLDVSTVKLTTFYSVYKNFNLGSDNLYKLHIGARSGTVLKDSSKTLHYHNGSCFSTRDRDCKGNRCPLEAKAGWWFNSCYYVNLNGVYMNPGIQANVPGESLSGGIVHYGFTMPSLEALSSSKMMFRRVQQ